MDTQIQNKLPKPDTNKESKEKDSYKNIENSQIKTLDTSENYNSNEEQVNLGIEGFDKENKNISEKEFIKPNFTESKEVKNARLLIKYNGFKAFGEKVKIFLKTEKAIYTFLVIILLIFLSIILVDYKDKIDVIYKQNSKITSLKTDLEMSSELITSLQETVEQNNQRLREYDKLVNGLEGEISKKAKEIEETIRQSEKEKEELEKQSQSLEQAKNEAQQKATNNARVAEYVAKLGDVKSCISVNQNSRTSSYKCRVGADTLTCTSGNLNHSCFYLGEVYSCKVSKVSGVTNCQ